MDVRTLKSLNDIEADIQVLREEIEELENTLLSGISYDERTQATNKITDPTGNVAIRILDLKRLLQKQLDKKYATRRYIHKFIDSMDDEEEQAMFRLRFIKRYSTRQIGNRMHMDWSTVARRLKKCYVKYGLIPESCHENHKK